MNRINDNLNMHIAQLSPNWRTHLDFFITFNYGCHIARTIFNLTTIDESWWCANSTFLSCVCTNTTYNEKNIIENWKEKTKKSTARKWHFLSWGIYFHSIDSTNDSLFRFKTTTEENTEKVTKVMNRNELSNILLSSCCIQEPSVPLTTFITFHVQVGILLRCVIRWNQN